MKERMLSAFIIDGNAYPSISSRNDERKNQLLESVRQFEMAIYPIDQNCEAV